ncbi:MAG: bifunctional folylpolyglutamate synthase/dihydrofolate synthase [Bernardetiaceae bacterium]|jgi:dihydrofolate synthase/folylpolyglutamate synthase|nr:bifunctional folylpolyglutamate synthase/dihydrofolate synthase [Bernardetiaceae bacterium]
MDYAETIHYLYTRLPMFQRVGVSAYRPNLDNTMALCRFLGDPQHRFPAIHVAGTNGKGSSSHLLAAIFQAAGYKTGLYTSPHLKDFTERVRINGQPIAPAEVVEFVARCQPEIERVQPSFFELTVALAFDCFARHEVDIAIVEVGLGGRLDSTNVLTPLISLITNISFDHQTLLGDTLPLIAAEKAGIIKPQAPVVISQYQPEVAAVFAQKAGLENAPLYFASQRYQLVPQASGYDVYRAGELWLPGLRSELEGHYQPFNLAGVLQTIEVYQDLLKRYLNYEMASPPPFLPQLAARTRLTEAHLRAGIGQVVRLTGLKGRWQVLRRQPLTVADTAHNEAGLRAVMAQVAAQRFQQLHFVLGVVADKDLASILPLLPPAARYYFCRPNLPRGLAAEALQQQAAAFGLHGAAYPSVVAGYQAAQAAATARDMVFVGGSTFVVAELEEL